MFSTERLTERTGRISTAWLLLLIAARVLADGTSCAGCHQAEATAQVKTSMAHALSPAVTSGVLEAHPQLTFREGQTEYSIHRDADKVTYRVQRGAESFTTLIQWAFGVGNKGQTYVYLNDGKLYEARVSFYRTLNGLDITTGHKDLPSATVAEAAGRPLSEDEAMRCFGCHSSMAGEELVPGVQCSDCHAHASEHASSFGKGGSPSAPAKLHLLSSMELADFCGRCHRMAASVNISGQKDLNNVRFQPYRLVSSRCFNPKDERISCLACHNPHEEVQKTASFYDAKCMSCHAAGSTPAKVALNSKSCPVGKRNCTSCHMPKVELPEMHGTFTDHRIRVVRKGEPYPA